MPRTEDIIFCKIAISNGLVTEEQAQKVLSICQKREREGGERPLIGTVFAKYNLMKSQDVQRVYEAVSKRTGVPVPRSTTRGNTTRIGIKGNGKKGGATTARMRRPDFPGERRPKQSQSIDPTTLWMGITGMVVFLGVVFFIFYLVFVPSGTKSPEVSGPAPESSAPTPASSSPAPQKASSAPAAPKAPELAKEARKGGASIKNLPREIRNEIDSAIADAKAELEPQDGVKKLESLKARLEERGYEAPSKVQEALAFLTEAAKEAAKASSAAPSAGAEGASPSSEDKESEKAGSKAEKEEAQPGSEESAGDVKKDEAAGEPQK